MRHRIFIAINLPEKIKKHISVYQIKWAELPCRWTKEENLHITLAFLGYLSDEELVELCGVVKEVSSRHEPFVISLNKIIYGPPKQPSRMVWLEGERSEKLGKLKKDLENSLPIEREKENRQYVPHITLGRLKMWEFREIEPAERPEINEDVSFSFEVKSINHGERFEKRRSGIYYFRISAIIFKNLI